jgi:chorismate mutase
MDISDWRKKIDEVDAAVLELLNLRAGMAIQIGKLKAQEGIGMRTPTREREIVVRMQSLNPGPLDGEEIARIYEAIVNQCIRAQGRSRSGNSAQSASDGARQAPAQVKGYAKSKVTTAGKRRKLAKAKK